MSDPNNNWGEIQKVTLTFGNVTRTLEGKPAKDWMDAVNSACVIASIHGCVGDTSFHDHWKETPNDVQTTE